MIKILRKSIGSAVALLMYMQSPALADINRPIVVELFTSQGCSSCPQADDFLRKLNGNPAVLPLSFHVHYWNYLGWKDPYSSEANTNRQRIYVHLLHERQLYTPMFVVDGRFAKMGPDHPGVHDAIRQVKADGVVVPITLTPDADGKGLHIHVGTLQDPSLPPVASVYAMHFIPDSTTAVNAGENEGRTLSSVNSVTKTEALGIWKQQDSDYQVALKPGEGVAVLLQGTVQGSVIGAASYKQ